MNFSNEQIALENCVREAAKILQDIGEDKHIESKTSAKDLVTMYDKAVQDKLFELLSKEFPKAGFLGEEEGLNKTENVQGIFIIDPIDGTTNFIKNMKHSCISVGYYIDGDIRNACVFNPFRNEMFTAEAGKGAYLNGNPIHVSLKPMKESVGLYGTAPYYEEIRHKGFMLAEELTKRVIDTRRMGSAALDLCYVAAGRAELYVEMRLPPWDYAAGYLIAKEAGAIVSDMQGKPLQFSKKSSVACGTSVNYKELLEIIASVC